MCKNSRAGFELSLSLSLSLSTDAVMNTQLNDIILVRHAWMF